MNALRRRAMFGRRCLALFHLKTGCGRRPGNHFKTSIVSMTATKACSKKVNSHLPFSGIAN
jgi:hypothetical protein